MPAVAPQLTKPYRWAISPGLVDPNWRWAWRGLICAWPMWEGAGNPRDASPIRDNGTLYGSVSWQPGRAGYALGGFSRFNTVDSVRTAQNGIAGSNPRSIEVVFKKLTAVSSTAEYLFGYGGAGTGTRYSIRLQMSSEGNSGAIRSEVQGGYNYGVKALDDGEWHHVFSIFGGATTSDIVHVVDGSEETASASAQTVNTTAATMWVGNDYQKQTAGDWVIALFCLYDRALTVAEAQALAHDPFGRFRMVDGAGVVYATAAAPPQTVTPGATLISSGLPSVTAVPGAVVLAPGPTLIAAGLPSATVAPGGVTLAASPLSIIAGLPATTAVPGQVTMTPQAVGIASGIPGATIVPGAVAVTPAPTTLQALLPTAARIPGAVSVSPSAVTLASALPGVTRAAGVTLYPSAVTITTAAPAPAIVPGSVAVTPSAVVLTLAVVAPGAFIGAAIIGTISLSGELALVVSLDGESLTAIPLSALRLLSIDLQGEVP